MKNLFVFLLFISMSVSCANAFTLRDWQIKTDERAVKSVLNSQVKYANKSNFEKFISTYDKNYKNSDGFDLNTYSSLVKDLWNTYDNIKYGIKFKQISFEGDDKACVKLVETSQANIPVSAKMNGELKSWADSVYYLKKTDGKWKVISDAVIEENTSMMYGDAMNLDVKLTAPKIVEPNYEYTASLEFIPPKDTFAIASIAKDKVVYPQQQAKEVFRKMPEDNILERLFISNSDDANEYIVASIGLTKADVCDMSIKLSLTGFGYQIIRVNVQKKDEIKDEQN
ncbi:hypothetical protein IJ750_04315 [bacterium]|nr:hypothetical protein [bacterium]